LDELSESADALRIAERLMQSMKEPFQIGVHELHMGVSIGVAVGSRDIESPQDLLAKADTAMYYAKTHGRSRIEVFSQEMRASAVARIQLEHDLRRGIENSEFINWYQAIINLETGRIAGVEALVRWQHPTRGVVHPDEFVSTAEETGLMMPIGTSVLIQACRDVVSLQKTCHLDDSFAVSVNLSCTQFAQSELVEKVKQALKETGLPPSSLKLEITESMVMTDPQSAGETLRKLKALGVKLEIDDFGTGYSSLRYLANYPVDGLKIDRSFVSGMERNLKKCEVTRTIIGLADNLGLEVVAEGIETAEQSTLLRLMGCEYGQGYHLSEPCDISAVTTFISERSGAAAVSA
jgi:EAL domain-containing protein (putative c-di-GMP-specific phosphodiesterase class I)